ncbi:hypothetical protein GmHk_08G021116 [Glycine max]|nr:hypothetical protein GmHk_08G021116 [Glycine max]
MHKEISSATSDGDISSLLHDGVSSSESDGSVMVCVIENERKSKPGSVGILGVIDIKALCPSNGFGVKVVIQCDGVIKNHYVSKVELICQYG